MAGTTCSILMPSTGQGRSSAGDLISMVAKMREGDRGASFHGHSRVMHGLIGTAMGCTGPSLMCLFALLSATPLRAAEIGQRFASVQAFVDSMPQGRAEIAKGYGDLAGAGRRDWAAAVSLQDPEIGSAQRVVVLTQQADGSYQVAAQGPTRSTDGGTGHHGLDGVRIKLGSVFVSWS